MLRGIIRYAASLQTLLRTQGECRGNTAFKGSEIDIVEILGISEVSVDEVRILREQCLCGSLHARIFATESRHENGGTAIVVEFIMYRALRANGALVQAEGGDDAVVVAVFLHKASLETGAIDEDEELCCARVRVHAVEPT